MSPLPSLHLLITILSSLSVVHSTTFTLTNNCSYTIWPGILGTPPLSTTGFSLNPGESRALDAPVPWSGRFWGRTLCTTDPTANHFTCTTADCGSNAVECNGSGAAPPATLAEFTLGGGGPGAATDFYDVSLVDGYNVPIIVVPSGGGGGRCAATGCVVDVNGICPAELRVNGGGGEAVACRSACEAFKTDRYCCSGECASPEKCGPTEYSQVFKRACPTAYSYAYDDATSTFTCSTGATVGYVVTFCASGVAGLNSENKRVPLVNETKSIKFAGSAGGGSTFHHQQNQPIASTSNLSSTSTTLVFYHALVALVHLFYTSF